MLSTADEHRELTDRVRSRTGRVEVDFANLTRASRHHGQLRGLVPAVFPGARSSAVEPPLPAGQSQHPCSDLPCASMRQPISGLLTRLELPLMPSQPVHHLHSCFQLPTVSQRALPNDSHSPSCIEKVTSVPFVSLHVVRKFGLPEVCARRRGRRVRATCMPVPEATVNEAHGFEASEHDVWSSGETPTMQSVSETASVKCPSKSELGLRAPVPDSRHHARPGGWIHYVRHHRLRRTAEEFIRPISQEDSILIKPRGLHVRPSAYHSATRPTCVGRAKDGSQALSRQRVVAAGLGFDDAVGTSQRCPRSEAIRDEACSGR